MEMLIQFIEALERGVIRSEFSSADALLRCHFILEWEKH